MQVLFLIAVFLGIVLFNAIVPTIVEAFCTRPWSNLNIKNGTKLTTDKFKTNYANEYKWWKSYPSIYLILNFISAFVFATFILSYGTRHNSTISFEMVSKMFAGFILGLPVIVRATNPMNYATFAIKTASIPQLEQPINMSSILKKSLLRREKDKPRFDYYLVGEIVPKIGKKVLMRGGGVIIVTIVLILLFL